MCGSDLSSEALERPGPFFFSRLGQVHVLKFADFMADNPFIGRKAAWSVMLRAGRRIG